jgi:hypothetical protein
LWRVLPALEELQTAWEEKLDDEGFVRFHPAIRDGLAKVGKYYSKLDKKPVFVMGLGQWLIHYSDDCIDNILQCCIHTLN